MLIVDDAILIREELKNMIFRKTGCNDILEADDIKSALKIIAEVRPKLIIIDLALPDGSGFEVLTVAKLLIPDATIIILTNYPYERFEKKAMELGATYFFDKSFDTSKVLNIVAGYLESKPSFG